jgi:CHAT domain-containing protein
MPSVADVEQLIDEADQAEDRYGATGDLAALEMALHAREAILAHPALRLSGEYRVMLLNGIGSASLQRYWAAGSEEDLNRAIQSFDEAVDSSPPGYPELPGILTNLGNALRDRHLRFGELRDLERMMGCLERAVDETPAGSSPLPGHLNNLGNGLRDRYLRLGDIQDLEQAINLYERSIRDTPPDSPDLSMRLANLGTALRDRHELGGARDDLDRAVDAHGRALEKTPPDSPLLPTFLNGLALALLARFRLMGDLHDLDRCIKAQEQVVRSTHPRAPNLPLMLSNLASSLLERYETAGGAQTFEQAIDALERAIDIAPPGSQARSATVGILGKALLLRYRLTGSHEDFQRAIEAAGTALVPTLSAPTAIADLAWALSPEGGGDGSDWEEQLAQLERALQDDNEAAPRRIGLLTVLGHTLLQQYQQTGADAHLDGCIRAFRYVHQKIPPNSPYRPGLASALGGALLRRYQRTGNLAELEEAIDTSSEAVSATPPDSPELPGRLVNLGNGLWEKHRRTHTLGDLEAALEAYQDALEHTQRGAPARPSRLYNLAAALRARFGAVGNPDDLKRAIDAYREAVKATPPTSPDLPGMLTGFGAGHWDRYEHSGGRSDLNAALDAYERAVTATPVGSPDLPARLNNLGNAVSARHALRGELDDLEKGHACYREACRLGAAFDPVVCMDAARNWGRWAASYQSWEEAAEAYGYGLEAMGRLFRTQLLRRHKETWLAWAQGLPSRAAFALAKAGNATAAAVALEQGRALLLSETLERDRANLERLGNLGRADLAERYRRAADRLAELERGDLGFGQTSLSLPDLRDNIRPVARAEFDAAIAEIRKVAGYERFLDPPTYADVGAAAEPCPLVYLASAEVGGLALVISGDPDTGIAKRPGHGDEPAVVWLPGLTESALREQVEAFRAAHSRRRDDPAGWRETLDTVASWLWDAAMGPVLEALGAERRVVLVPAGLLGLLPLHAAWTKDPARPTGRRYALDEALLTYAPNARALLAAQRLGEQRPADRLLTVDEPRPVQAPSLPSAAHETAAACAAFAPHVRCLHHEQATRQAVTDALDDVNVLHLACHGYADLATPLDSGLVLAGDELLRLRELFTLRLSARLGVLSACETALPGTALPDEVVSLPTGLLQAGVAGVVASLWAVPDDRTMLLMVDFYRRWRCKGRAPAEALRQAQRWLRDSTNGAKRRRFDALLDRDDAWLPRATVEACFEAVVLQDPKERSFADPTGWAAFSYIGT